MPTYEYECANCAYRFEVFQKMSDTRLKKCPKCGRNVKRLISSGAGIIFKGPGFYATDYRKKPEDKSAPVQVQECPLKKQGCNGCSQK